ncbi:MAG: hypothetical protein DA408_17630 [Bacteroidetes bacterium]|nr:MAG: hypothetical protein C7N36_10910 [Bacteroidota bacterium]PTM09741.1 MAG: hypothetical protein DA408_17630 [Bacteroidota bacterium]
MKYTLTLSCFLLVLLTSCATYHRIKSNHLVTRATLGAQNFYQTIDYEYLYSLPVFSVEIENKTYRFIFDTGGYTVFSDRLMDELSNIREVSYIDVKDGNNQTARIRTYLLDELKIGGIPFRNVGCAKIGFTEADWFTCLGVDGTIGPNIMKTCLWLFDNTTQSLVLTDQKDRLAILQQGTRVPIKTNNIDKPLINFSIGNYTNELTFDTGFNGLLTLMQPRDSLLFEGYPSIEKIGHRSNAGNSIVRKNTRLVQLDTIHIGGLVLTGPIARVEANSSSNSLGSRIFETHQVLFHLAADEVYFQRFRAGTTSDEIQSFGFGYEFAAGKIIVSYVYQPSPASRLGLVAGEEILRINGQAYHFEDYCDFIDHFTEPAEEEVVLEVLRNGLPTLVSLRKAPLLAELNR